MRFRWPKKHPAERTAALLFAAMAALTLVADAAPRLKDVQAIFTIVAAFVGPFLLIYAATQGKQGATFSLVLTLFFAMGIVLASYADIYFRSHLVFDTAVEAKPTAIVSWSDSLYFSIVSWTTLGFGDLQPRGWMRLVAASEALIGNIFLGTFIALLFAVVTRRKRPNQAMQRTAGRSAF